MRNIIALIFVVVAVAAPTTGLAVFNPHYAPAIAAGDGMQAVSLVLKKMKGAMASLKDLDDLEDAGMSKKDVDRMRRAMKQKIQQMTNDAVDLIRVL